jgi:NifU-like protein involved in Fe-S cluster formation
LERKRGHSALTVGFGNSAGAIRNFGTRMWRLFGNGGSLFGSFCGARPVPKYSETSTDHVMSLRNGGAIKDSDLTGHAGAPGRGAFMIIYLNVQDERIAAARYHTIGCGPTIASGSMLTEMIAGKSTAECRELTAENLIEARQYARFHLPSLAGPTIRLPPARGVARAKTSRRAPPGDCSTARHGRRLDRVEPGPGARAQALTERAIRVGRSLDGVARLSDGAPRREPIAHAEGRQPRPPLFTKGHRVRPPRRAIPPPGELAKH